MVIASTASGPSSRRSRETSPVLGELGDPAQGARGRAFGEQGAQRAVPRSCTDSRPSTLAWPVNSAAAAAASPSSSAAAAADSRLRVRICCQVSCRWTRTPRTPAPSIRKRVSWSRSGLVGHGGSCGRRAASPIMRASSLWGCSQDGDGGRQVQDVNEAADQRRRARRWRRWLWRCPCCSWRLRCCRCCDCASSTLRSRRSWRRGSSRRWGQGDWRFRIAYDWRDLDEISRNVPLAMVASEDQNFAESPRLRPQGDREGPRQRARRGTRAQAQQAGPPLRGASTISQQTAKNLFLWRGRAARAGCARASRPGTRC